jgi:hypothetical protein
MADVIASPSRVRHMRSCTLLFAMVFLSPIVDAQESTSSQQSSAIEDLVRDGSFDLSFRYRFEFVDDDAFSENAEASTLRSRLTLTSGEVAEFQLMVELDDVRELIWDDFNAGGGNTPNRSRFPIVADPEGTEVNQAYVDYSGFENIQLRMGRQRINLDNQRFVGGVGWRQNEQTYDAFMVRYTDQMFSGSYTYVDNVNLIFGEDVRAGDHRQDGTHLLNASTEIANIGSLSGYYYHIDNEDQRLFSTSTLGLRLTGKPTIEDLSLHYEVEYARQEDAGNNPSSYDADYLHLDVGIVLDDLDVAVGFEQLGAERGGRFVTPLGTLHAFNGWADKFLAGGSGNPASGLEDTYIKAQYAFDDFKLQALYHRFESDINSRDLGDELNISFGGPVNEYFRADFFYADFDGDSGISDTVKIWLMLSATL